MNRTRQRTLSLATVLGLIVIALSGIAVKRLLSCAPYENGAAHGTAFQWGRDGRLLGSYNMDQGTGIDLWWEDWRDGSANLTEVHV